MRAMLTAGSPLWRVNRRVTEQVGADGCLPQRPKQTKTAALGPALTRRSLPAVFSMILRNG